jgi:hypothetical protein
MKNTLLNNKEYKDWLVDIKTKVRKAQLKAAVKVNTELLSLYWELARILFQSKNMLNGGTVFWSN